MESLQAEGIVLKSITYGEHDCILTVFTREHGVLGLFVKGGKRQKRHLQALCSPLSHAEFTYHNGKNALHRFLEGRLLSNPESLRSSYSCLQAACALVQSVSETQFPGKTAPQLFTLLLYYLERLPKATCHAVIVDSFRLKLLIHEGLLGIHTNCIQCQDSWQTAHFYGGEWYCSIHSPGGGLSCDAESFAYLLKVAMVRSFQELGTLERPNNIEDLIDCVFLEQMHLHRG